MNSFIIKCTLAAVVLLTFSFSGCGEKEEIIQKETDATDQMWKDYKTDEELYMFQIDGTVYVVDSVYQVRTYIDDSMVDGGFYKIIADVTYLNGGIAGYVDYPQIENVSAIEEISPFDIGLPSITEKKYGLTLIGDYADGDIFLNESGYAAVWKDGEWIWQYDTSFKSDSGSMIYTASGVSKEEALEGIEDGVLSCEEYFAMP